MSLLDMLQGGLGQVLGQMAAGNGGLGGSLGGDLGRALGALAGQARNAGSSAVRNAPGGLGGLVGAGALGTLLGSMASGRGGSSQNMARNLALLGAGAVAFNFYQKWAQKKAAAEGSMASVPAAAPFENEVMNTSQMQELPDTTSTLVLRAMMYAARADGNIDDEERQRIGALVQQIFPGQDMRQLLSQLATEPLNPSLLGEQVQSGEQAEDLYRLSCMVIDIDHFMERSYLDALGQALGIAAGRCQELEDEASQAKTQLTGINV